MSVFEMLTIHSVLAPSPERGRREHTRAPLIAHAAKWTAASVVALLMGAGCVTPPADDGGPAADDGANDDGPVPTTTDDSNGSITAGDGDGDDCDTFLGCTDMSPPADCDFWGQDCDAGDKCTPVVSDPTTGAWDAHMCAPAGTEAPGSACTLAEGGNGADTCDGNGMCYDIDPDTGIGTCVELCSGTLSNPACPITNHECKLLNDGILPICLPSCNPLLAGECPDGQTCVPAFEGGMLNDFICFPPAAEGITGEPCECANCCADGHICTDAQTYGVDCAFDLCCTEYCAVNDTEFGCAGSDQVCIPLFEDTDPLFANVGACQAPM